MTSLERTDCPPEPEPIGYCAVCHDEVFEWDAAETWTGELVHQECREDDDE